MGEFRAKIRFQIMRSIGDPKIQILTSKSGLPNRTASRSVLQVAPISAKSFPIIL